VRRLKPALTQYCSQLIDQLINVLNAEHNGWTQLQDVTLGSCRTNEYAALMEAIYDETGAMRGGSTFRIDHIDSNEQPGATDLRYRLGKYP